MGHFHALVRRVPPRVVSLGHVGFLGLELLGHSLGLGRGVLRGLSEKTSEVKSRNRPIDLHVDDTEKISEEIGKAAKYSTDIRAVRGRRRRIVRNAQQLQFNARSRSDFNARTH